MPNYMDYSLIHHSPDGTGMFLVTLPGTPDRGSYMTEQEFKEWIVSSIGGGIVPKGDILSSNLPAADESNKGWEYYCTDLNKYAISDGTAWIYFSNSPIVQTPDATDTGHALSNAVVTEHFNDLDDGLRNTANRVTSNSQRIANIEDKSEPFTIEYPSSDYGKGTVPASIEKSGMSVKVKGRTRAWNHLVQNGNFASADTWGSIGLTSITVSNNIYSGTSTTSTVQLYKAINIINSHKYLYSCDVQINAQGSARPYLSNYIGDWVSISANVWTCISAITTSTQTAEVELNCVVSVDIGSVIKYRNFQLYDLTLIFGAGNEPTSVTDALKALPDLGKYTPYGYSLPSTIVSGMKAISPNIWDEEWENGSYDTTTGAKVNNEYVRNKNAVTCLPNTEYYFHQNGTWQGKVVLFYDANGSYINYFDPSTGVNVFTTPANACFLNFRMAMEYGTTYKHDIQICINSYPQKTVYHPYSSNTLTFSEPVTLRSAGSVEDELIPESGKVTRTLKEIVCDENTDWNINGNVFYISLADGKVVAINTMPNILVSNYEIVGSKNVVSFSDKTCTVVAGTSAIGIRDDSYSSASDFKTAMVGKKIVYELATPTTETLSPSPTALAVEPYGEVSLIQDQDIELDGGFSMRYIPDSPYVKKADIVDNLSSSDVSKPLSANMGRVIGATLDQHDSRIKNLEQKAGDYSIVQYRGTNAVPTGKAKYGLVKSIVGKTRAWNQYIVNGNFANNNTGWSANAVSYSVSGNIGAISFSVTNANLTQAVSLIAGHKYLLIGSFKTSGTISFYIDGYPNNAIPSDGAWHTITQIINASATADKQVRILNGGSGSATADAKNIVFYDLTLIFGSGNEPSTVADALTQLPDLGQYNAYDAGSLVSTEVSGVKSVGVNIWDEEWEVGNLNAQGQNESDSNTIRSKNYIPCHGGVEYYFGCQSHPSTNFVIYFYDGNKNMIPYTGTGAYLNGVNPSNGIFTSPVGTFYMRFRGTNSYGNTYMNNIQICLNSYADKTTYHPYKTDTLSLSETVILRSAGSVAEVLDVQTGEVTHPVREYTFTGNESWQQIGSDPAYYLEIAEISSYIKKPTSTSTKCGAIASFGIEDSYSNVVNGNSDSNAFAIIYSNGRFVITATMYSNISSLTGQKIIFPLETPDLSTFIDPIPDNTLYTEGGGTIDTIQEQTPIIDNCLDVGYLAV